MTAQFRHMASEVLFYSVFLDLCSFTFYYYLGPNTKMFKRIFTVLNRFIYYLLF